jgi:hypothetical protein
MRFADPVEAIVRRGCEPPKKSASDSSDEAGNPEKDDEGCELDECD